MKTSELYAFLDAQIPASLSCEWDNDGLLVCPNPDREVKKVLVALDATEKVVIGLDYFDASINRLSAWITGQRSMQKALLYALLLPNDSLKRLQDEGDFTRLMVEQEKAKMLPFADVWAEYLHREGQNENYYDEIIRYEENVLKARN